MPFPIFALLFFSSAAFAKGQNLTVHPKKSFPGGVVGIRYRLAPDQNPASFVLKVNGKEVAWDVCPAKQRLLCAFAGVEMDDPPKQLEIEVSLKPGDKEFASAPQLVPQTFSVPVRPKKYPRSKLSVDPALAVLSEEDKLRVEAERAVMKGIYQASEKVPLWERTFLLPGKGGVTSKYGNQRTFNGKVASTHYGVDLRGNENTWVLASNAGKVVCADNLFYSGNFVAIDHGMGLFTTYSHLTSFLVKAGEMVKPGQKLGRAGATGRVTGPHLHWGVRINGLYVDPLEFLKAANH